MNLTRRNFYAKRKPARVAPEFHLPASPCGKPGSCVFALSDLPPNASVRFDVTPVECFGRKGRTIRAAELFTAPRKG